MHMGKNNKSYYYLLIIFAAFCLAFIGQGIGNSTKGQYVKPICDTFHWARTEFTAGMSIGDLIMFLGNVFFAVALAKLKGVRNVFLVGCLALLGTYVIFYHADTLAAFYCGWALYGLSQAYINTASYSVVVNNWFVEKRGTALGLIFAGMGIGAIVWNLVVGYVIQYYGWRQAYLYSIIAVFALALIALLILRNKPSDMGLLPYGAGKTPAVDAADAGDAADAIQHVYGFTLKEALKEPFYWIAGIGILFIVMSIMGVFINAPGFLGDQKATPMVIAYIISLSYVFTTIGKILGGFAIDKFGAKKVLAFCVLCFAIGTFILTTYKAGGSMATLYGYIFFYGFGLVTLTVPIPIITHNLFGNKDFPAIMGTVMAFFSFGGVLAGPSGSLVYDILHSYVPAFYGYVGLAVIALLLLYLAMSLSEKKWGKHDEFAPASQRSAR
jgi:sugar phosphate permease